MATPLTAVDINAVGAGAILLLAAEMESPTAVAVLVHDGEVVIHIAEAVFGAALAAAGTRSEYGQLVAHRPGHKVNAVDSLLDDVITVRALDWIESPDDDEDFDETKRLFSGTPVFSPFVRHNPNATPQ